MQQAALAIDPCLYRPTPPEESLLYQVIAENLETFLEQSRRDGHGLPRHVEREFYRFLDCRVFARGFSRFRCAACG